MDSMIRYLLFTAVSLFFLTGPCTAGDIEAIDWMTLVPELPAREDPFAGLSDKEIDDIEWIIYLRMALPEEITPQFEDFHDELQEALPRLKKKGIDVDEIIADRRFRNSALNTELDGRLVKLSGYLLPLDLSGSAVTDFLLVPYVGACIHVPPPPPNQIVYAVSATPVPYEIDKLFHAVTVTGRMKTKSLTRELFLVDGSSDIDVGYSMTADKIDKYMP